MQTTTAAPNKINLSLTKKETRANKIRKLTEGSQTGHTQEAKSKN